MFYDYKKSVPVDYEEIEVAEVDNPRDPGCV